MNIKFIYQASRDRDESLLKKGRELFLVQLAQQAGEPGNPFAQNIDEHNSWCPSCTTWEGSKYPHMDDTRCPLCQYLYHTRSSGTPELRKFFRDRQYSEIHRQILAHIPRRK